MTQWTFVRHGQSRANAEGWLAGVYDSELTERGRQQAVEAGKAVRQLSFARVFSSDLSRARDTATLLLGERAVPRVSTADLRERHCGVYEHRTIAELEPTGEMEQLTHWDLRPPGGESLRDVAVRAIGWLAGVDEDIDTLVVAHGALIRAVIGVVDGRRPEQIGLWRPKNCQAVQRGLPPGTWARLLAELTSSG